MRWDGMGMGVAERRRGRGKGVRGGYLGVRLVLVLVLM